MSRFDDAIRTLREDVDGASPDAPRTLERVLARTDVRRRRIRLLPYLAAAAAFVATVAWAGLRATSRGGEAPAASASASLASSSSPIPLVSAPTEGASANLPVEAPPERAPSSAPRPIVAPSGAAGLTPSARREGADRDAAELAAYEQAHRAHFVDRDAAAALRAWDGYLASYPKGPYAPEAAYNRAICLLRLSREAEAKKALEPFATGQYGSYRRKEASLLLSGLADAGH